MCRVYAEAGANLSDLRSTGLWLEEQEAPFAAAAVRAREARGARFACTSLSEQVDTYLNFDLVAGVDDAASALEVSPVVVLEATSADLTKAASGAFTRNDVGRPLTILSRQRAVFVNGV